jgi:hypothetical protein
MTPSPAHRPRLNAARRAASPDGSGTDLMTLAGVARPATRSFGDPARMLRVPVGFGPRRPDQSIEIAREAVSSVRRRFDPFSDGVRPAQRRSGFGFGRAIPLNAVNAAVNQMDQVTQHNVAVAESSTTAMHPPRQDTENLVRLNSNIRKAGSRPIATARCSAPLAGRKLQKEGVGSDL